MKENKDFYLANGGTVEDSGRGTAREERRHMYVRGTRKKNISFQIRAPEGQSMK